ncbi:MAG: T9SS type A sorting domain-containing protein [Bacteroidota bacterium]
MIHKGIPTLITILFCSIFPFIVQADIIYATQDGNWGETDTWSSGSYPGLEDTVVIDGYHVYLNYDTTVKRLELNNSAGRSASLSLYLASDLTVTGDFYMLGETDGNDVKLAFFNYGTLIVQGLSNFQRQSSSTDNSIFTIYLRDVGQLKAEGGMLYEYHDAGTLEEEDEIQLSGFSKITVTGDLRFLCHGGKRASIRVGSNASLIVNGSLDAQLTGDAQLRVINNNRMEISGNTLFTNSGGSSGIYAQMAGTSCKIGGKLSLNSTNVGLPIDLEQAVSGAQLEVAGDLEFNTDWENTINLSLGEMTTLLLGGNLVRTVGFGSMIMDRTASLTFNGSVPQSIPETRPSGNTTDSLHLTNLIFANTSGSPMMPTGHVYLDRNLELSGGIIQTDADNLFILKDSVGISGGSSTAYIDGPIRKIGRTNGDSLVFHIGNQGFYAPFEISRISNPNSDYTVQYLSCPPPIGTLQNGLIRVSELEYWIMTSTPGSDSVDVRLYWQDAEGSGINNLGSLVVTYFTNATGWMSIGNGGTNGMAFPGEGGSITNDLSCPPPIGTVMFTYGSLDGSNPLPLAFGELKAYQYGKQVELNWITESNFDYFEVEHSTDAFNFSYLKTIDAKSGPRNNYQEFDAQPETGINYYRIRMFDPMGQPRYSDIATVQFQTEDQLQVYPNPVTDHFELLGVNWEQSSTLVSVYRSNGQMVYEGMLTADQLSGGLSAKEMNILYNGTYYLILQVEDRSYAAQLLRRDAN